MSTHLVNNNRTSFVFFNFSYCFRKLLPSGNKRYFLYYTFRPPDAGRLPAPCWIDTCLLLPWPDFTYSANAEHEIRFSDNFLYRTQILCRKSTVWFQSQQAITIIVSKINGGNLVCQHLIVSSRESTAEMWWRKITIRNIRLNFIVGKAEMAYVITNTFINYALASGRPSNQLYELSNIFFVFYLFFIPLLGFSKKKMDGKKQWKI